MRYLTALLSRSIAKIRSRRSSRMFHRKITFARRLRCELLEHRNLMAVIAWDGGAATMNWNDRYNWVGDAIPGAADDVTINVTGSDATILLSGANASVRSLNNQEGLAIDAGATLTLSGETASTVHGIFVNSGTVHVQNGSLTLDGGSTSSGTFTIDAGAYMYFQGSGVEDGNSKNYILSGVIQGEGIVYFRHASATLTGLYDITGTTTIDFLVSSDSLNFNNVQNVGSELSVVRSRSGAAVNFYLNNGTTLAPLNVTKLALSGASLNKWAD